MQKRCRLTLFTRSFTSYQNDVLHLMLSNVTHFRNSYKYVLVHFGLRPR